MTPPPAEATSDAAMNSPTRSPPPAETPVAKATVAVAEVEQTNTDDAAAAASTDVAMAESPDTSDSDEDATQAALQAIIAQELKLAQEKEAALAKMKAAAERKKEKKSNEAKVKSNTSPAKAARCDSGSASVTSSAPTVSAGSANVTVDAPSTTPAQTADVDMGAPRGTSDVETSDAGSAVVDVSSAAGSPIAGTPTPATATLASDSPTPRDDTPADVQCPPGLQADAVEEVHTGSPTSPVGDGQGEAADTEHRDDGAALGATGNTPTPLEDSPVTWPVAESPTPTPAPDQTTSAPDTSDPTTSTAAAPAPAPEPGTPPPDAQNPVDDDSWAANSFMSVKKKLGAWVTRELYERWHKAMLLVDWPHGAMTRYEWKYDWQQRGVRGVTVTTCFPYCIDERPELIDPDSPAGMGIAAACDALGLKLETLNQDAAFTPPFEDSRWGHNPRYYVPIDQNPNEFSPDAIGLWPATRTT